MQSFQLTEEIKNCKAWIMFKEQGSGVFLFYLLLFWSQRKRNVELSCRWKNKMDPQVKTCVTGFQIWLELCEWRLDICWNASTNGCQRVCCISVWLQFVAMDEQQSILIAEQSVHLSRDNVSGTQLTSHFHSFSIAKKTEKPLFRAELPQIHLFSLSNPDPHFSISSPLPLFFFWLALNLRVMIVVKYGSGLFCSLRSMSLSESWQDERTIFFPSLYALQLIILQLSPPFSASFSSSIIVLWIFILPPPFYPSLSFFSPLSANGTIMEP